MRKRSVDSVIRNDASSMRVGIIAGSGSLPLALATALQVDGKDPYLLLIEGEADPAQYKDFSHEVIRITKVGRFLKALAREKCTHITLAGPVKRPNLKNLVPDMEGVKLLARITGASRKGDDGLMRAITGYLQEKGFTIIGAHELASDLLVPSGQLGKVSPTEQDDADIAAGVRIVKAVGALDIGQAAILRDGYVLAVEAAEGTDGLLTRSAAFAWDKRAGVLVKLSKPGQELKADMPTIGPETVTLAAEANLRGIALEEHKTLILDMKEAIRRADVAGIFLIGLDPESGS